MTELEKEANELAEEFFGLPSVKRYLAAKKEYETSPRLSAMRAEIASSKKRLGSLDHNRTAAEIRRIGKLENEYDADETVVTYNELKQETEALLEPIRDLFRF